MTIPPEKVARAALPEVVRFGKATAVICRLTLILWIVLFGPSLRVPLRASPIEDVAATAQAVDRHYNHLRTLETDFMEIYTGAGTERTESGTLWLKKPGKMRWEYRSPRGKVFLSDGKEAWFFTPDEKQARKISMHQLDDLRSPLAFLLGKTQLQKELKGLSWAADVAPLEVGDTVLRGAPITMENRVSQVVLEITSDHRISRLLLDGTDGSVTEYRFSNPIENVVVPEQLFHFIPPPDVEIIEGDLAQ